MKKAKDSQEKYLEIKIKTQGENYH